MQTLLNNLVNVTSQDKTKAFKALLNIRISSDLEATLNEIYKSHASKGFDQVRSNFLVDNSSSPISVLQRLYGLEKSQGYFDADSYFDFIKKMSLLIIAADATFNVNFLMMRPSTDADGVVNKSTLTYDHLTFYPNINSFTYLTNSLADKLVHTMNLDHALLGIKYYSDEVLTQLGISPERQEQLEKSYVEEGENLVFFDLEELLEYFAIVINHLL